MEYSAVFGCCKDFFSNWTRHRHSYVMCCVQFEERNEHLRQMAELFETNACKLSRAMIFLTNDQNGLFAHVKHSGKATTKTNQL